MQGALASAAALVLAAGVSYVAGCAHQAAECREAQAAAAAEAGIQRLQYQAAAERAAAEAAAAWADERLSLQTRYDTLNRKYQKLRAAPPVVAASGAPCPDATFTLGAVRVWNGALFGADAPEGACGAAGATAAAAAACAAASGVSMEAVLDNHTANARSCAEDRARLAALVAWLRLQGVKEGD